MSRIICQKSINYVKNSDPDERNVKRNMLMRKNESIKGIIEFEENVKH